MSAVRTAAALKRSRADRTWRTDGLTLPNRDLANVLRSRGLRLGQSLHTRPSML